MKTKLTILILLCLLVGVGTVSACHKPNQPEVIVNDKQDEPCTGEETAGRCVDKCPNQTDTLLGYDEETGAAICKLAPTGCPYGDSVPLGAECDKLAPPLPAVEQPPVVEFRGK